MIVETWYKIECPSCGQTNWVIEENDEIEALSCHECKSVFDFSKNPEQLPEILYSEDGIYLKNQIPVYIVEGRKDVTSSL